MNYSKLTLDLITEELVALGDRVGFTGHDLLKLTRSMNNAVVHDLTDRQLDAVMSTVILLDLYTTASDMPALIDALLAHIGSPDDDMFNE
jgi:hypothetical protein